MNQILGLIQQNTQRQLKLDQQSPFSALQSFLADPNFQDFTEKLINYSKEELLIKRRLARALKSRKNTIIINLTSRDEEIAIYKKRQKNCIEQLINSTGIAIKYFCVLSPWLLGDRMKYQIAEGFKGILFRFERCQQQLESGIHLINPISERVELFDCRKRLIKIQKIRSYSSQYVRIQGNLTVFWQLQHPTKTLMQIQSLEDFIRQESIIQFQNTITKFSLQEMVKGEPYATAILDQLRFSLERYGFKIENVVLTSLKISKQMIRQFNDLYWVKESAKSSLQLIKTSNFCLQMIAKQRLQTQQLVMFKRLGILEKLGGKGLLKASNFM